MSLKKIILKLSFLTEDNPFFCYLLGSPLLYFSVLSKKKQDAAHIFQSVFKSNFLKIQQIPSEFHALLKIVGTLNPKVMMEVGTYRGGTLLLFTKVLSQDSTILSLDLPRDKMHRGYAKWRKRLYPNFANGQQRMFFLQDDSHSEDCGENVVRILDGRTIDFLFIDADHTYSGVKRNYELYSSLLSGDGVLALHDIVPDPNQQENEVYLFWKELRKSIPYTFEIVEDYNQGKAGIGILCKSDAQFKRVISTIETDRENAADKHMNKPSGTGNF